ncbi:hypothetical protein Sru01_15940 [Sphaerisporangium rufum]|uniref:Uncharacterized protein n=1 Tax=Sphaerisporangium rufum TaxID=1381558 RepID=A0A919R3Z1_9ACTN|nr:hypothetical protein [Sphaerisporangium rufum]GII76612.1 hypothetical protein Sru01_15940 [Sphaerisporangium rufum]
MKITRNPGLPPPIVRGLAGLAAARAGRRDGRLGVPYDRLPAGASPGGPADDRRTDYITSVAEQARERRLRVRKRFIGEAGRQESALLQAAGLVNDLARRAAATDPAPAGPGNPPGTPEPRSLAEVTAARARRTAADRRRSAETELATARQALAGRLADYAGAVRRMRAEAEEVNSWAGQLVARYRRSLDHAYLTRQSTPGTSLPRWEPAPIRADSEEERLALSGDLLTLLPPKVREVIDEALGHLGRPIPEGGAG